MADKYSIDDILSEYSNKYKTNNRPKADDPDNFDISFSKPENKNPAAVIPDIRSDRTAGKDQDVPDNTSSEKNADDAVIKKAVASSQRSDDLLMSDDLLDNASPIDEDLAMRNARKISKLSETNVNIDKNGELSAEPVRRTSVKDIKFGLEGKIIPQSKYLDDISDEENTTNNAAVDDYDSRSAELERHRKSKVESFVLDSIDDDEAAEISKHKKISYGQKEFENYDEAPKVLNDILQIKSNLFLRLCVLLFTGLSSLLITIANDLEFPVIRIFDRSVSPSAFLFSNTIMGLLALGVSYSVMTAGLKNMFLRKPDNDSIAAVGIFVSVIAGIATLFEPDSVRDGYYHVYVSAAIMGLIFNTLGKMMTVQRTEKNFRYIAGDFDRYAVKSVDGSTAVNLGRGAVPVNANMAAMRKTSFIEDFIKNSYAPDVSDRFAKYSAPIILIAGFITGLLSFICDKHAGSSVDKIYVALAAFSGTVTMCSSLSLILAVNLPISKATNKYLQYSSVILGYSAVEEFSDTNSVMVDAVQLFPKESVDLINLKLLSTEPLDECILLASSLVFRSDSVLKNSFYKILKGKLDMLYPVESYIYEDERGLSGWIDNKRVLLGTRQHMEDHSIDGLPPVSKEAEYGKGNVILYLSISGVICTMFVLKITPSISVTKWMQALEK